MAKEKLMGLMLNGSLKQSGVTFYTRNGKMIARSAHSNQPERRSQGQFVVRQRMKHTTALWGELKVLDPMFSGGKSAYGRFCTLMRRLPVVFTPKYGDLSTAELLLPEMPVSDGVLPVVKQYLGEVEGHPALLTELSRADLHRSDRLLLYTMNQVLERDTPRVRMNVREVKPVEFQIVDDHLALVDDEFDNAMKGWALVRVNADTCSSQGVVTRCRYFEAFTTVEAMLKAAESYGGLTD